MNSQATSRQGRPLSYSACVCAALSSFRMPALVMFVALSSLPLSAVYGQQEKSLDPRLNELVQQIRRSEFPAAEASERSEVPGTRHPAPAAPLFLDLTGGTDRPDRSAGESAASRDDTGERQYAEVSLSDDPVHVVMRAVAWIVIALCLFSLGALGVRRWQRQRGLLPVTNSRSRVIETLSLGPGRTVSLIELAGFRALVASDAGGIKQLVLTPVSFQDELTQAETEPRDVS